MLTSTPQPAGIIAETLATEDVRGMLDFLEKGLSQIGKSLSELDAKVAPVSAVWPPDVSEPVLDHPTHYSPVTRRLKDIETEIWRYNSWLQSIIHNLRI